MYTALRTMKVQNANGEMRTVQRGDPVPEAAGWRNVRHYINRNYLCLDTEFERLAGKPAQAPALAPAPSAPEPPADDAAESEEPATYPLVDGDGRPFDAPEAPVQTEGPSESDIRSMNKTDLQAVAVEWGVNPDQTKKELVAALLG